MEGRVNMVVLMTLALAAMLHGSYAQTTHVVGDGLGWLVPPGGEAAYRTWAASRNVNVGDILVFNFATGRHDVAEVSRAAYDSCNSTSPISLSNNGPTNITLTSAGEHHFICTFTGHCDLGQKLAINVSSAPAPQPATPTPAALAPAPAPSRGGMVYTVGDGLGWNVPPGGAIAYQTWTRGKIFVVGNALVFNFTSGVHNVVEVTRAEFDSCNISTTTNNPITTSPARITLTSPGEHYYICTFPQHCSLGQKLAINVTAGGSTVSPAPAPSSTVGTPPPSSATPPSSSGGPTPSNPSTPSTPPSSSDGPTPTNPSTPSTPSPVTAPPPPSNSAPTLVVAALPFTLFVSALAFLYN